MIATLISLGLMASAFVFSTGDLRVVKMNTAMVFATALGLLVFHYGNIKGIRNKWLLILMAYLPLALLIAPKPDIKLFGMNVGAFWAWQPMYYIWIFFCMAGLIATYKFYRFEIDIIIGTLYWCGFLTAIYVVMQYFHIDQFFYQTSGGADGRMAGFIGNPTLTSPYIAMMIPFAWYLKKYWQSAVMMGAVIAADSQMAIGAMVASLIVYISLKGWRSMVLGVVLTGLFVFCIHMGCQRGIVNDSDRFAKWPLITSDIVKPIVEGGPTYPLTGIGLGSFKYTHHIKHKNNFFQAHNEYLEVAYNLGIVGLVLFILSIVSIIKPYLKLGGSGYDRALLASFSCIALSAFGTFIWQIGTTIFATVVVAGLMMNKEEVSCV